MVIFPFFYLEEISSLASTSTTQASTLLRPIASPSSLWFHHGWMLCSQAVPRGKQGIYFQLSRPILYIFSRIIICLPGWMPLAGYQFTRSGRRLVCVFYVCIQTPVLLIYKHHNLRQYRYKISHRLIRFNPDRAEGRNKRYYCFPLAAWERGRFYGRCT